jgi:hypothetical protein
MDWDHQTELGFELSGCVYCSTAYKLQLLIGLRHRRGGFGSEDLNTVGSAGLALVGLGWLELSQICRFEPL